MKTLITLVVCCTTMLSVYAQGSYNTVTINYNGQNRQVLIDGRSFTPVANDNYDGRSTTGSRSYNFAVVTNELAPGTHKLSLVRQNNRRNVETSFILRSNYDLTINVDGNGSLQKTETYRKLGTATGSETVAMSATRFNALVSQINRNRQATTRYNMIQAALSNSSYYFTTTQAKRLITLINGEPFRLQLAKTAVARITDTRNLNSLGTVLASQAGRNELAEYIRQNATTPTTGTTTVTSPAGSSFGNSTTAMSTTTFNSLYEDVRNRYGSGVRLSALQNAFAQGSNLYFSTAQVSQIVQLLTSENERLQILKQAYSKVIDPTKFTQTYTLLNSISSRDDLADHIRMNGTTGNTGTTGSNTANAMSEGAFNTLLEGIRNAWGTGVRKREVLNAFANTSNYFSVYQASQLVQLESNDRDRLDLAKASLRSIVDRQNMALLYNALTMQSSRDELAVYVNSYNNGTAGNIPVGSTSNTPMSDANFATLLEETRRLWLPGAKKATVLQAFTTQNNFFTTAQAIQLIQLDSDEDDRLEMAKASYKTVIDKQNFTRVYDIFTTQSYRNELINYVNSNQ